MKNAIKVTILVLLCLVLAAEVVFVAGMETGKLSLEMLGLAEPTQAPTEAPTEVPTELPTVPPTTVPPTTVPPTEPPQPEHFLLSFGGDCTFGSTAAKWKTKTSFITMVGDDYDYPFSNVVEYLKNDDFTIVNFEGVLAEGGKPANKRFTFRGPLAYTNILTGSSVEAVTLANNHSRDFGEEGYASTKNALDQAGVTYVEKDSSRIYTTESGLTIGLYAGAFDIDVKDMAREIQLMRQNGAELIICAFHWGEEGKFTLTKSQQTYAKAAIDVGADIVYGHHPHVLQRIEHYKDKVIMYSTGNFSFGGNNYPKDFDTALIQQEVIRDVDGTIRLGEMTIIPCSVGSKKGFNDFKPTPLEEGYEAYNRVLSKLDGSFDGPDFVVNYG